MTWSAPSVVGAGRPYDVTEPPDPRLRLSFAGADQAQLSSGVRLLADALDGLAAPA